MSNKIISELIALKGEEKYKALYREWNDQLQKDKNVKKRWLQFLYHDILASKTIDKIIEDDRSLDNSNSNTENYIKRSIYNRFHEFNNKEEIVRHTLLKKVYNKTISDLAFIKKKSEDCKNNITKLIDLQIKIILEPYTVEKEKNEKYLIFKDNKVLDFNFKDDVTLQCFIANIILCKSFGSALDFSVITVSENPFGRCQLSDKTILKYWFLFYLIITNLLSVNIDLSIFSDIEKLYKLVDSILQPKGKEEQPKSKESNKKKAEGIANLLSKKIKGGKKGGKGGNGKKGEKSKTPANPATQLWWTTGEAAKIQTYMRTHKINLETGTINSNLYEYLFKSFLEESSIPQLSSSNTFNNIKILRDNTEYKKNPFCLNNKFEDSKFLNKMILDKIDNDFRQKISNEKKREPEMVTFYKDINNKIKNALPFMSLELYMKGEREEIINDKYNNKDILNHIIDFYIYLYIEKYKLYTNYIKLFEESNIKNNISRYNIKTNSPSKTDTETKSSNTKVTNNSSKKSPNYNNIIKKLKEERERVEKNLFGTTEGNEKIKIINKLIKNTEVARDQKLGIIV
jgi:hypothetical protein